MTILFLSAYLKHRAACKRLSEDRRKRANSYEVQRYRAKRTAALKGIALREHRLRCGHGFVSDEA